MRERTPSADDTPKRAPPAPSREAVVAGSETPNDDTIEAYRTAKLPGVSSASDATSPTDRMVASMQSLEDLAVNHPANATGSNADRQQQQQDRYGHAYRSSAQTAQDKRSRLSNVINNLRKKVPDGTVKESAESPRKEEDDRNSVERNLETLEKYVMTVLNGVIKDDEEEDKGKTAEMTKEPERRRKDVEEEENSMVKYEPSNESDIEAAVVPCLEDSTTVENTESSKITDPSDTKEAIEESIEVSEVKLSQDSKELSSRMEEEHPDVEKEESSESDRDILREKTENRTLGTIIMDRLSEHQVEERANVDDGRGEDRCDERMVSENMEVRAICIELLDELLNNVYLKIDNLKSQQKIEECEKVKECVDTTESRVEKVKESNTNAQEVQSLHCSLPLEKITLVFQNCQISESVTSRLLSGSSSNPPTQKLKSSSGTTPPVRLLCLYCDRKFSSISLRQRHTERVHQLGGRRSERNSRKSSQNCQYCSEKCADTLETLFQHMITNHADKYHACVQCLTRFPTREALMGHMSETHSGNAERTTSPNQAQEKIKEESPCKEFLTREIVKVSSVRERRSEEKELETSQSDSQQTDSTRTKLIATRDSIDNPASPEFDSSFYSNVSCNIRENLLHHLDGKLQTIGGASSSCAPSIIVSGATTSTSTSIESKSQQQPPQQSYYEHSANQIQFPIDISLTAATPVYSKDYSASEEYENSSEYARKAGKTSSSSRPRRVSFEKYNFPRKYDGREQWTCSIKDLSKFDISTQLSLRKKQQLIKEHLTISRLSQISLACETTEVSLGDREQVESAVETAASLSNQDNVDGSCSVDATSATLDVACCNPGESPPSEIKKEETTTEESPTTSSLCLTKSPTAEFTLEFANFMRVRRREQCDNKAANIEKITYAELSGEWSRTRIYICGACGSKHTTLKEMEDHKASTHPHVLCSHFELTGDQREHYKHLYLPGQSGPTDEARDATLVETACTKCTKNCLNVAELHRHMLECGGDHAWLIGLTGSGKKKCKWRPFGSRSRRRRQRGMKRNIQNSQTQPRIVNPERPKEKQTPTGPRVRPSDRESIQKMLANLPPKRATRKVMQDNAMRSHSKLRNVQSRTRPRIIGDSSSVSRISRNKAALRNKLLKNAKSIQRNRCRSDNITAVIESVVKKCHETGRKLDGDGSKNAETEDESKKDAKEINEVLLASKASDSDDKIVRPRAVGRPKMIGKKGNMKTGNSIKNSQLQGKAGDKLANFKAKRKSIKFRSSAVSKSDAKGEETSFPKNTPKNSKTMSRTADKNDVGPDSKRISTVLGMRKNKLMQGTLKRKRPVDPVASLNASLKAKSQLRTQDGKFARNPNKVNSSTKSEKMDDKKRKTANSVQIKLLKSKAIQKLKRAARQLPRRVTRLSSDSDKMPTLEPVVQIVSSNEDSTDKLTNDLPILSPVTSSGSPQDQKTLRTSVKYILKEKEGNTEVNTDREVALEKSTKEQKSTRGRKPKQKPKDTTKQKEVEIVEENEISKNSSTKERRAKNKKNLHIKNTNNGDNMKEETSKGIIAKKDLKLKKEDTTKEIRSNSKTRVEKDSTKLPDIPFEVKKLLGSASKEDLLNTLELASNDGLKRNLRQSTPRSKTFQASDKSPRELDDESNSSKVAGKKEKIETRKSSRKTVEKKSDDKMVKTINLEKDSANNATNHVTQNERSQQNKKDNRASAKTKEIDTDIEDKIDSRQTRRSLIDARSEPSSEVASGSSQKGSGLFGKRRRNKSTNEDEELNTTRVIQKQNNSENMISSEKKAQKKDEFEETVDKDETEGDDNSNSDDRDSTMVNLSLSHLQSETSNLSVDSGKENSLETPVSIHNKLKVTRPKKTWGARRERSSRKRSLNNVIGILTEGINIPVEQSVQVLTVQTSLDNPERVARNGSTQQPIVGEGNVIAVDSAFSELSVLARNEQESAENEAANANDNHRTDDEKNARPCINKTQDENAFTNHDDVSSKVSTAKVRSPANDIILDLSRRKPKGKGSFLEKIVSKIAKQKDALLESEVGSLLDSAADELTSILNEVEPALADNTESADFGEVNDASKNDNSENVTSTDKKLVITTSETQSLEDVINIKSAASERSADLLVQDNHEENLAMKIEMQVQSKNQSKVNDISNEVKDNCVADRQVNNTMRSVEESQVESCENKSATNEEKAIIPMEIPDETPSSLTDTLTEISISSATAQELNEETVEKKENGVKSRRKSNKRSLKNASWPKKSKRKVEAVEELVEKEGETMDISKTDAEIKALQNKSKNIKDMKLSSLEKVIAEDNESNLEKIANLSEANKLTANLEEVVDKIISDDKTTEVTSPSIEVNEESIESSSLVLKKTVKSEKSADRIQKKNQTNAPSESLYRRTSKRKSKSLSNVLQTSVKPINEDKNLSSLKSDSTEFTSEKSKIVTTDENSDASLEKSLYSLSKKCEVSQNADDSSFVNSSSSKTTKKHGKEKKSLADEHLDLSKDEPARVASKLNEVLDVADSNEQLSASLEHFKIPEVKDLLQSVKKRSSKKKLLPEDDHCNSESVSEEPRINEELAEVNERSNLSEKIEEQMECKKHIVREQSSSKNLERASSSGSIGLIPSLVKTRSMLKKTQLSNEDLAISSIRNQDVESTDDLSESSCVSESSYFRKKRFAKRKKKDENMADDNERADSVTVQSDKENSNKKVQNTKSLLDEHLDLSDVDDIDIPMDIQASLENTKALENIERELELAEKSLQNEDADDKSMADNSANKDATAEQSVSNNYDSPDDPITPKKRAAGNFVVVHTKTGEILIVEKRKKLTKEAAKFFCDVCATSFTRKSSLKKHTLSLLHLAQMAKSSKDKTESINNDTSENAQEIDDKERSNQVSDRDVKSVLDDAQSHEIAQKSLESNVNSIPYGTSTESLVDLGVTRQEMLEDKLLDEEICKITENMSHDEYVLTDQVTPEEPLLSSTPVKQIQKKQEESGRGKNDKKRNKSKKRNLAEEHLILDSPELEDSKIDSEDPLNLVNDLAWNSQSSSKIEMAQTTIKETKDIPEELQGVDAAEPKNQVDSIVKSLNDKINDSKLLSCDTDMKGEHMESTKITRSSTKKICKIDNDEKEENQTSTEINIFSQRPRRRPRIRYDYDLELNNYTFEKADIHYMDAAMEINKVEIENSCDSQKKQTEMEEEMSKNALQEMTDADTKNKDADVVKSKSDSTNDSKKKKRSSTLKKFSKIDNDNKEENQTSTEINIFSQRPRRRPRIRYDYELELNNYTFEKADIHYMDAAMEINKDEMENSCDSQKRQTEMEEEMSKNALQEMTDADTKNKDADVVKSKSDSTNDSKKKKWSSTLKKFSKIDNDSKEENQTSTENNSFSQRPRRKPRIRYDYDLELNNYTFEKTDIYYMDAAMEINKDEMENSCDSQKKQTEMEEEMSKNALQEMTDADTKNKDADVVKSKSDSTNDSKKRKRGCTLKKFPKVDNDSKEENQTSTENNSFSQRPRRRPRIRYDYDLELNNYTFEKADIYYMDAAMEINKDEMENSCDSQKKQTEMEEEMSKNALQEMTDADIKNKDTDVVKSKSDSTNDNKKKKRSSTLKKFSKIDNDSKEENQSTENNSFSQRPRRKPRIRYDYDLELNNYTFEKADIYYMDAAMEINNDEMENSCDSQKRQTEMEEEMSKNALQEMTDADTKNKDADVVKSKSDSTNDTKKRKRGRPRLKDRIVLNSSVTSAEFEVENDVTEGGLEESKSKDQKLISPTQEHFEEVDKTPCIDANIQPSKRRGRPRKNLVQVTNNFLIQTEDSNVSESIKSKCDELKEKAAQIETEMKLIEEAPSITLVNSLTSNVEPWSAVEDHIGESNLSETNRDELKVEENGMRFNEVNNSGDQLVQKVESTNVKNCDMLAFNVPSEKNKAVDTSVLSEMNVCADNAKYQSEGKSDYNDSTNILIDSTAEFSSQINEKVSNDNFKSVESIRTIELDSIEFQKVSDISEEKSGKEPAVFQEETKLTSQSEDSENEVIDDKSLPITNSHELPQKTIDHLENYSIHDKKTTQSESSNKKSSESSPAAGKERETSRRKSKASRGRRKKITKVAQLSSDSENEVGRIESASSNKSKIVKSVFGRVFGGEKADKVKEVLNDWVSRSEDDSDISRSASEARSCLRGSTKTSEIGHKKDKKRHSGMLLSSDTKKDAELSSRKNGNDKDSSIEVHGKLNNRKKRELDFNLMPEDRIELPINPVKRKHRESKIRADEKILRTFDDESLILSEGDENVNEIIKTSMQIDEDYLSNKDDESGRYYGKEMEWNEGRTKDKNSISTNCENLRVGHNAYEKSKNSSSYCKKQDANAKSERFSSPLQFNMFKCRRRESKTKAGERIWKALDNEISSYFSDDQDETHKNFKERESVFYESEDADHSSKSKSIKHKDDDIWKNSSLINQEQVEVQNARGRSRKDSNSRKKQNFNPIGIDKTKMDNIISKNSDNESSIALKNPKTNIETQNDKATRSTSESKNRSKNLTIKDNTYESLADTNYQQANFKKNKKGAANQDWNCSMKNLDFDQKDRAKDNNQSTMGKEIRQKHEVSTTMLSRSCSNLTGSAMKDQFSNLDGNSQTIRESDNDDNNDEEGEQEDDDDDNDNDLGRRRMSPFYACETPDSSIESSSNNEEDEEEEDEEERITQEDTCRKTNSSEFSGEKIIIRSPSSGHRSDVVTIAPTDAIEDNALDVPREIESTTEPRQGKILNFDEELFVECCSRLKATSENELRGAKKIKLDHTESYHRRDDQPQGFRVNRDRWRDVESQNSLGSLLESVNQLLGEEMCNSHDRSYRTRGSEQSSRSASPDISRVDNLGYEDSLDVAFEHNNKLRDKIQQRMRESENLIASTFGQKTNDNDHPSDDKRGNVGNSYSSSMHEHEQQSTSIASNRERVLSPGQKNKVNSSLGGLLDKTLSNLLHSNSKHDHNGSAPMKLLAELACARAPTSTSPEDITNSGKNHQSVKMVPVAIGGTAAAIATKDTSDLSKKPTKGSAVTSKTSLKKTRNPIKELFERKKEMNDRKEQERSKITLMESNVQKPRKPKRGKKQQQQQGFPLIRRNELYSGLAEKKKRRESFDRKGESERIKDVYEFDEEESQTAPTLGSVMSYRSQVDKSYETNWPKKDVDEDYGTALENGKTSYIADTKLGAVVDRKFQELEKFAPKTKGALKSFQSEEQQQQQRVSDSITGPMDDFVERKQRIRRLEQSVKSPSKLNKKRGKSSKRRARNAWYENDSSDEFRTAAKTEDVGVGISKSQRACSKGKQNLFAELSTSSESEYERENDVDCIIASEQQPLSRSRKSLKKQLDVDEVNCDQHIINESKFDNENQITNCENALKGDYDAAKSESEMSDRSLVIDERKTIDEARNSDDDADNQYERTFELDDLYREDSSETETEVEGNEELTPTEETKDRTQALDDKNSTLQTKVTPTNVKDDYAPENELIPLEEALDFLDRHEDLESKSENVPSKDQIENDIANGTLDAANEVFNDGISNIEKENKHLHHREAQDEKEEPDDDVPALPEKLSSNEKPQKESDNNLPLHVFLSRKVQESKKRKQQQLDKLREEQERILMDFQPTRRQRKCAIGKQGLLAEISSSDEESYARDNIKRGNDHDKSRKKRESKEKKKERYLEKKHEQMIAKEQKAIEEEILRQVGKRKEILTQNTDVEVPLNIDDEVESKVVSGQVHKKKSKEKQRKSSDENIERITQHTTNHSSFGSSEDIHNNVEHDFSSTENIAENNGHLTISSKRSKLSKSPMRLKKSPKSSENGKIPASKKKESTAEKFKKTSASSNKDSKERRSSNVGKHDSDDEELKTTKSWNKVEEGVGVAIGRRKRTAALQLYYWSSSSDEEEIPEPVPVPEEEEDDRQEQHGWIVGDSHKRMITMLAMEKQQKEKRRRSEDEFESGKSKSKKHRNSTS